MTKLLAKKNRNSNLELLRIIAMVLIIMHHFSIHGFGDANLEFGFGKIIVDIVSLGGKFGVNLFIMISAYFMCDSASTPKKLIRVVAQTISYSIIILLLGAIFTPAGPVGATDIIKSLFPITFSMYWFVTDYILLALFSPFLNLFIQHCPKALYKRFVIMFALFAVVLSGTIPAAFSSISSSLIWFIGLYLIIGYIKKYVNLSAINKKHNLVLSLVSYTMLILSCVIINVVGHLLGDNDAILNNAGFFLRPNSIFVFVSSLELFLFFLKMRPKEFKVINLVASTTFGVFLIHTHILIKKPFLWQTIFQVQSYISEWYLFFYAIGASLLVFAVCSAIDLIRQKTIERLCLALLYGIYDWTALKIRPIMTKIENKLEKL